MEQQRRTPFVSVNLTPQARDALRIAALDLSALAGRRLSMSVVVVSAVRVALRHRDELAADVTAETGE
jgi:hypothetical protein